MTNRMNDGVYQPMVLNVLYVFMVKLTFVFLAYKKGNDAFRRHVFLMLLRNFPVLPKSTKKPPVRLPGVTWLSLPICQAIFRHTAAVL